HLKTGVRKDGTIVAMQGQVIHDCGAYMDAVGSTLGPDMAFIQGPYRCPNVDLSAVLVYTNNPPTGHVRGPRCPQEVFPIESHIDEIAHKLNIDPIEMRMRNIMQDGDKLCFGGVLRNVSAGQILEATRDYMKKQKRHPEPNTGWGIALGQYNLHPLPGGMQATSGCVKINDDGTLVLLSGTSEQGAGIVTVLQQIVAEEFGVSMDRVTVSNADSDAAPWERGTGASQTTTRVGAAVRLAAQDARDQLLGLAASKMDVDPKNMTLSQGKVYFNNIEREPVSLKELAAEMVLSRGGPILGTGLNLRKEMFKKIEEEKGIIDGPSYGTSVVKVSVDPDTGEVKVLKCYSIWDAGFAINPSNVEGQIEGGVVCGIGYGLTEDIIVKDGRILNNSLVDYCLPVSTDVPKVETEIMEVPSTWGPYGAKGLAEGANGPVAAAVANAVFNASGVRIRELPLTRERIFMGMKAK
ncbi:MAG: molybdopterin cofactor-binding domain-containing protein, partial [Dehalococcoidia bacterium]|nr:molybdopterin cofactor-binding domain-containing protein [Dehalococcoidia bacterium]